MVRKLIVVSVFLLCFLAGSYRIPASVDRKNFEPGSYIFPADTTRIDTTGQLPFPFKDEPAFSYGKQQDTSRLFLKKPSNITYDIQYDPITGDYVFYQKIGDFNYRLPKTMSLNDYMNYDFEKSMKDYWRQRSSVKDLEFHNSLIPKLTIGSEAFNRVFGGNTINIRPQGFVEVSFGYQMNSTENPAIPVRLQKVPSFDFNEKIQMNVVGEIGTKMKMRVNYNTDATFDYENKMNLEYTGDEDEIIKRIEAGNVSLPLSGTLITGASNLFGIKSEMQFGKLTVTTLLSQSKGESKSVETQGGAQITNFEIQASDYDANRHFFLAQYFRDHYTEALKNLQYIQSNITINKIEVWVTNKSSNFSDSRNILAFQDLAEKGANIYNKVPEFQDTPGLPYPDNLFPSNATNGIYSEMKNNYSAIRNVQNINATMSVFGSRFMGGRDFEKIENARKLSPSEYTVNLQLGYISLNSPLNADEILAVAFNYTANGRTYQVGEFSTDGIDAPQTLMLKLIKGTNLSPNLPTWKLMMKNVYNLNTFQLAPEGFVLNIMYQNDSTGTYLNYLPESRIQGHILLQVLKLDQLNSQKDPFKDGVFDYIEGVTVNKQSGRIIFPVLEPFGKNLADSISDPTYISKYVYQSLYDSTRTYAEQDAEHNKFILVGSYKGTSSSDIAVGSINLAPGSVKVTAGGMELVENVDYTVDYALGRVRIINQGLLESAANIKVSTESQDLFSMQRKTLLGVHANYEISKNFNLAATMLHMQERPLTQKVNYGEDPISNTMLGFDTRYSTQSELITKLVDKLPFIDTKTPSSINVEAEFARLFPGHSKVIKEGGAAYIDDFEGTKTSIDLKTRQSWVLASTPQYQQLFPEANLSNSLAYGYNRAKLAWYVIDPLFLRNNALTPDHIRNDKEMQSNQLVREVFEKEIFPAKETPVGEPTNISVFDLAYYPSERGPYNFDTSPGIYSSGINNDGSLRNPKSRWAGIMRKIESSDFEAQNIEFIEFWMMDPFVNDSLNKMDGGDLYFNLGDISEDVLKDSRKSFENGLPTTSQVTNIDTTVWGRVSTQQSLVNSFDNDPQSRQYQDIGFDGLSDTDENTFFKSFLDKVKGIVSQSAYNEISKDPSADDYHYFRGTDYDEQKLSILDRYKKYNGPDGNSPTTQMNIESYPTAATSIPDIEDINDDNTLNEYERYYQYKVSIRKQDMSVGHNYITDIRQAKVQLKNGNVGEVKWYQFKIPVRSPDQVYGSINDFKSIRFLRLFLNGFADPTILRFATLDLVRSDWRHYTRSLSEEGTMSPMAKLEISAVNIEENGSREPINYILPPGIDRVVDPANPQLRQLNEQSMVLKVTNLEQGDAKGAYKNINMDFRMYKTMKMEVHAEEVEGYSTEDDDLSLFVRIGSDYNFNYYEYEVPLKLTPPSSSRYNGDIESDRYIVWPDANRINLPLELFTNTKLERDAKMRQAGSTIKEQDIFETKHSGWNDGKNLVKVKGNPNLGNVVVMMIGIRNNKKSINTGPRSVEVWVNELRLTNFNEEGGWAGNARISARLADLGMVTFAGRTRSSGFGGIEQRVNQRALDNLVEYDIASSIDVGRFFPKKMGVSLPMFYGYSRSARNPKYDPLNPDIELTESLKNAPNKSVRDSIKSMAQDLTTRKSINFTNVRIAPQTSSEDRKAKIYDPENFSFSYSYNEVSKRNINTEYNVDRVHKGMMSYNYSSRAEEFTPFKKISFLQRGPLKFIGNFGFFYLPTQITFRTDVTRNYNEIQTRNITDPGMKLPTTYQKDFLWNRFFDLRYNITNNLRFDFSSSNTSRIDEPEGRINRHDNDYQWKKDSILHNIWQLGRPTVYNHNVDITYQLPLNMIKFLNFISASAQYRGTYNWQAGPLTADTIKLGNTVQNSQNLSLTTNLSMTQIYNQVPYFREINSKFRRTARTFGSSSRSAVGRTQQPATKKPAEVREVTFNDKDLVLLANQPKRINHKLNTEDVTVKVTDKQGQVINGNVDILDKNKIVFTPTTDVTSASVTVVGKRTDKNILKEILDVGTRILLGVQNISASYSIDGRTILPGYLPAPKLFGSSKFTPAMNIAGNNNPGGTAPGIPFLFGWQDDKFPILAANKGWITADSKLNTPYAINKSEGFRLNATIEPLPDIRIELNADRSFAKSISEFLTYNSGTGRFEGASRSENGSFSMSTFTWGTAFFSIGNGKVKSSEAFEQFKKNRYIIAQRLAGQRVANPTFGYDPSKINPETNFPIGYGPTSVEVMVPAFLAAYQKRDPYKVSLSMFPSIKNIRPNWRITYDGMVNEVPGINRIIKSLNFTHSYRSTYNVGAFLTNLNYLAELDGYSYIRDIQDNFIPAFEFNSVTITETFSPLINVDIMWVNELTTRAEIKRSRLLNMSFSNNQLTESLNNEYIFGFGYRFTHMDMIIKTKNSQKSYSNDLNITADLSVRKNETILRKLVEDDNQITAGTSVVTIKTTADYNLSDRFQVRLYFDKVINTPFTSVSYRTANTNLGVTFRFTLAQ